MPDEDIAFLREMLQEAYVCRQFVHGRTRPDLDDDLLFYYAVAKVVELIGEAAWNVSDATKSENPEIEWGRMAGMRHRLVHDFQGINRDILWMAAQHGVPALIPHLEAALWRNTKANSRRVLQ